MIALEREDDIFILHMRSGENRLGPDFSDAFEAALDEVEASSGSAALVSVGADRFYSNGLDLDAMGTLGREGAEQFLSRLHRIFARLLAFPVPTVAAVNGHAFAAGAMLALAHDFRVMRRERGYFCLPEIDMATGRPLTPGMVALIGARLERSVFHDMLISGHRYTAEEARVRGIVQESQPEDQVLPRAIELAKQLSGKDRPTLAALKRGLFASELRVLEAP